MITFEPAHSAIRPAFIAWPLLQPEDCARLVALGQSLITAPGTIGNAVDTEFEVNHGVRSVSVATLVGSAETEWIYKRIASAIAPLNQQHFRFDITGIVEPLQFLRYDEPTWDRPAGHYRWHLDIGGGIASTRKLSLSVQLSNSEDYEGGDLVLFSDGEKPMTAHRGIGTAVLFPSYAAHMVRPITRGVRFALVVWISGPPLR